MRISRFSDFGGQNRKSSAAAPERRTARDFFFVPENVLMTGTPLGGSTSRVRAHICARARVRARTTTLPLGEFRKPYPSTILVHGIK